MIETAFCSTKHCLDDDLYKSLKQTAHKPHYDDLNFDQESVCDINAVLMEHAYKAKYTNEVLTIDHKGETLTIKRKKEHTHSKPK